MSELVSSILNVNLEEANKKIEKSFHSIMEKKLFEMKKMVSAKMYSEMNLSGIKPSDNIEDRRGERAVNSSIKTDLGGPQRVVRGNKGDLNTSPQTVNKTEKTDKLNEEQLEEARVKIVRARVRGGKVQRRTKVSNVEGMTIRGGKLTRMSPAERRRRKMGARKAKVKRKSKRTQMQMKRKRSMMRRRSMGL